ncbi:hypothetical protein [Nitrosococcus watsonii]|uniref:Short chain amide porin n=1 Tax=Nitrosococcus watsoni (strain C-113) TaxID=105559 RepID=D8K8X6_NITWC|nr:hypothetical protein [Nitrosococcus watsonii]ADJ27186.1 conserved hypothetical protein [Nitrosococcus watsonii C-113]
MSRSNDKQGHYRSSIASVFILAIIGFPGVVQAAAGYYKFDETKWISVGGGLKSSFKATENGDATGDGWSTNPTINNFRIYVNGQLHKYIKFEFNTECAACEEEGDITILDGILKFDITDYFNIWLGRMLTPATRGELSGPFFQNIFEFNRTPFYPSDFSGENREAGRFGRDEGMNIWGALGAEKRFTYVAGIFRGHRGTPNLGDGPLYAARVSYNFWNVEQNPGYYTSSTYYGTAGDIFTVAAAFQYQDNGVGTSQNPADFLGTNADLLIEKVLANKDVLTLEGEYQYFVPNLNQAALSAANCFCIFEGHAYMATALYLFSQQVWVGQFQPYMRWTDNRPSNSSDRNEVEVGLNYVLDGHDARISLFYQYGDINTKGRVWVPGVEGEKVSAVGIGVQLQLR